MTIGCPHSQQLIDFINFVSNLNGYTNGWIINGPIVQRFSKRFLIYGLSKRSLNIKDHPALNQSVYAQLLNQVNFAFAISDIKVSHFMENFAVLLSYNNQLSDWMVAQNEFVVNTGGVFIVGTPIWSLCVLSFVKSLSAAFEDEKLDYLLDKEYIKPTEKDEKFSEFKSNNGTAKSIFKFLKLNSVHITQSKMCLNIKG